MKSSKEQYKRYVYGIIGFFIAAIVANVFRYSTAINNPVDSSSTEEVSFLIYIGDSVDEIADSLEKKELISSSWAFYWYTRLHDLDENIISGRFMLNQSMTVPEILTIISDPAASEAILTIQEGLTIKDIDTRLAEMEFTQPGEFTEAAKNFTGYEYYSFLDPAIQGSLGIPVEGYLFPDTYFLEPTDFHPDHAMYRALDQFETKIEPLIMQIEASPRSFHEIITMASIIEKEVFGNEDRHIVSGILWKRLDSGWRLDADATLLYTKDDNTITAEDLATNSPYNTRLVGDLPPGPICNPSLEAIEAAINPTSSNYWFYLNAKDGTTVYASSNEEHNVNKAKWL
jgi:UPF0755 protein